MMILSIMIPICLSFPHNSEAVSKLIPVVLDVDLETDPTVLYSIAQAVRHADLNILGITTQGANPEKQVLIIRKLLDLTGRQDIPTGAGKKHNSITTHSLDSWIREIPLDTNPVPPAYDLILQLAQNNSEGFEVIACGPLSTAAQAIQDSSATQSALKRILIPSVDLKGNPTTMLARDPEAAAIVFSSTVPIVLFDQVINDNLNMTEKRMLQIGWTRSPLGDALTQLGSLLVTQEQPICIPSLLPLGWLSDAGVARMETKGISLDSATVNLQDNSSRSAGIVHQANTNTLLNTYIDWIHPGAIDFGTRMVDFYMALGKGSEQARQQILAELNRFSEMPFANLDPTQEIDRRQQNLAYLSWNIQSLEKVGEKPYLEAAANLKEAYLRIARIGLAFPDYFYRDWYWGVIPGQVFRPQASLSNLNSIPLKNIKASWQIGSVSQTFAVDAADTDTDFLFDGVIIPKDCVLPSTGELVVSFECDNWIYSTRRIISIRQQPEVYIQGIEIYPEKAEVFLSSATMSVPYRLTLFSMTSREVLADSLISSSTQSIHTLHFDKPLINCGEPVHVALSDVKDEKVATEVYGLVISPTETIRPIAKGPSRSPLFANERDGKWGLKTQSLDGNQWVEYQVQLPASSPSSATPYLVMTAFNEGDPADSFMVEVAPQSGNYLAATPAISKPESRGWMEYEVAFRPEVTAMLRNNEIQWLRINSRMDGDEIIREIHLDWREP